MVKNWGYCRECGEPEQLKGELCSVCQHDFICSRCGEESDNLKRIAANDSKGYDDGLDDEMLCEDCFYAIETEKSEEEATDEYESGIFIVHPPYTAIQER